MAATDLRATAGHLTLPFFDEAHRSLALELSQNLSPTAMIDEVRGHADASTLSTLGEVRSQQDAARRWRELAHRLLSPA